MQQNWQFPFPASNLPATGLADLDDGGYVAGKVNRRLRTRSDRFDYRLIFSACFAVFVSVALIKRCNPISLALAHGRRRSIWRESKEAAHRCAGLAMQA